MNRIERFAAKAMTGELLTDVWGLFRRAQCAAGGHATVRFEQAADVCRCGRVWIPAEKRRGW